MGLPLQGPLRAAVPPDSLTPRAPAAARREGHSFAPGTGASVAARREARAHAPGEGVSAAARREARAGLYVHVPFCAARCSYCDFSTGALSAGAVERYLAAMEREADLRAPQASGVRFTSVFFGGGTPSALCSRHFRRLWSALGARFTVEPDAEITLEANPESVRDELLATWASCGVNRLSFGAQSFLPEELRLLGRVHTAERPALAVAMARAHGFRRLSIDLMFGFPGHTRERWARTLARALELETEHLSAYNFIPEPGTPLGNAVALGHAAMPEDEEQAEAYEQATATLGRSGLEAYETSNFCRPGAEARHNLVYWLRRPYLGLGPSAHGFIEGRRYGNAYGFVPWATAVERGLRPDAGPEPEGPEERAREILMLGLRLACGLDPGDHPAEVWAELRRRYGRALDRALDTGRLEGVGSAVRIPPRLRFVADDVIAWIDAEADRSGFDSLSPGSILSAQWHHSHSPAA